MNHEQAAAAFRAHNDAQPDVTVTLDLIPDPAMMEEVGQVEAALRLAYPSSGNVFADLGLPHAEQLLGSADKLCAMLDALRLAYTALKEAEDYTVDYDPDYLGVHETCPSCPARKGAAHTDDCDLAAALAAIRALLPEVDGEEGTP